MKHSYYVKLRQNHGRERATKSASGISGIEIILLCCPYHWSILASTDSWHTKRLLLYKPWPLLPPSRHVILCDVSSIFFDNRFPFECFEILCPAVAVLVTTHRRSDLSTVNNDSPFWGRWSTDAKGYFVAAQWWVEKSQIGMWIEEERMSKRERITVTATMSH